MNEYSRTELLIGEEGLGRLKQATVMVFGVGGVGSHCMEALARSGAGRLILIDNDKVSLTNINRQSIAYHSTIGRMKTEVMRERIRDINPEIVVKTYETFVLPDNVEELFEETPDYIIDAIDTVTCLQIGQHLIAGHNIQCLLLFRVHCFSGTRPGSADNNLNILIMSFCIDRIGISWSQVSLFTIDCQFKWAVNGNGGIRTMYTCLSKNKLIFNRLISTSAHKHNHSCSCQ